MRCRRTQVRRANGTNLRRLLFRGIINGGVQLCKCCVAAFHLSLELCKAAVWHDSTEWVGRCQWYLVHYNTASYQLTNKKLSYRRDSEIMILILVWMMSLKVSHPLLCQSMQHIWLLFAYNCSRDIMPRLCIHTPPLFQVELWKDGWEYVDILWCQDV